MEVQTGMVGVLAEEEECLVDPVSLDRLEVAQRLMEGVVEADLRINDWRLYAMEFGVDPVRWTGRVFRSGS